MTIVNTSNLNFGMIIRSGVAGTVTINNANGARSFTGGVTLTGSGWSRATFTGLTDGFGVVEVILPVTAITLNRAGGGASMPVNLTLSGLPGFMFINQPARKVSFIGDNTVYTFGVGGTVNVAANQLTGAYSATFTVTANYF